EVKAVLLALIEAYVVEDEELGLSAEVSGVGKAGGTQVHLSLPSNVARIAVVTLLGHRIDDIANHHESWRLGEGIGNVSAGNGNQQHVALVNGRPAADRRAIHAEAVFKAVLGELLDGIRNVMPQSGEVGKTQVQ